MKEQTEIVIYQDRKRKIEVELKQETLWLDAHKMAELLAVDRTVIVKHIGNIYKTKELDKNSTCAKIAQVAADGKKRKMNIYNLDVIIAVGYRVNSRKATQRLMLTDLCYLVAASPPEQKEQLINLIINFISFETEGDITDG